jgi:5-methylcytosine-specific restriction protein A
MPTRPPVHAPPWHVPREQARQQFDDRRGSAASRGYDHTWRRVRLHHLATEPLCRFCAAEGLVVAAEVVDHIQTIADRPDLRLDDRNLRSLCAACHNRRTATEHGFATRRD